MLCPNCQKEAINVNGKYVCLDCGVEIAADSAPTTPPEPSTVINHGATEPADISNSFDDPQTQTVAEPFVGSTLAVSDPAIPQDNQNNSVAVEPETPVEKPVEDLYLKSLAEDTQTTGTYDFSNNQGSSEEESEPKQEVTQGTVQAPTFSVTPENQIQPAAVAPEIPVEPVVTTQDAVTLPVEPEISTANEIPQAPAVEEPAPIVATAEVKDAFNQPALQPIEPIASNSEPVAPVGAPIEPANQTQATENPTEDNFFQPVAVDIAAQAETPEPKPLNTFDAFSTPATPSQEPLSVSESAPESASERVEEPKSQIGTPTLDDLLDSYSTPSPAAPVSAPPVSEVTTTPAFTPPTIPQAASVDTLTPPTPQTSDLTNPQTIPSVENVFGPDSQAGARTVPNANKKILIIGAAVLGIIILSGIVFGIMSLTKSEKNGLTTEQLLKISQDVSTAMDDTDAVSNTFKEKIDFSGASIVELTGSEAVAAELKTSFAKPVETSGTWQEDSDGNTSFDGTIGGVKTKKILNSSNGTVYNFVNDAWTKDTLKNLPEFPLFSLAAKGQLFYNSKLESLSYLGKEKTGDEDIRKLKIIPKGALVQDIFAAEVPALAKNSYKNIDLKNLSIIAEIDSTNTIKSVIVSGSVEVDSDFFTGVVTFDVNSVYEYEGIEEITVPEATAGANKPTATKPEFIETDTTEVTQRRVVITDLRG